MDTGIRECTILGQAIGTALRGLRPIAEIQYLDYILYALQIMSDDLATTRWRSAGGQACPVIVRTRGHRLEGIWHSGSPMAGIINLVRGMHVCVPRNMTQAAGFYNTLLRGEDPAIVIEVLNGYRTKEKLPSNIADMTLPLGVPEVMREGKDVTLVSYGATLKIVAEAAELLARAGIDAELIDIQTLLPFDVRGIIAESVKKTNRVVFIDEDARRASAFMLQQVVGRPRLRVLDSEPRTIAAKEHRPRTVRMATTGRSRIAKRSYGRVRPMQRRIRASTQRCRFGGGGSAPLYRTPLESEALPPHSNNARSRRFFRFVIA
jgi:pyruvate/2-oxoglutarate/acetoin dehydrogenase E1 component